jgi:HAD superfamily hydrolase (TIGR01509 family)
MPPFDAAIFDLDGTLIDTEALANETGVAALRALGHDVGLDFFATLAGMHDAERARRISDHVGARLDPDAFNAEWDRRCLARFAEGIPLKPGATDLLDRLCAMGMPLALATSSRRKPAQDKLRLADLARHFRAVITFDDVIAPKPDPDPYLRAAAALGADPARCIAFEDSETGARAAFAAGCRVVQVPDLHPASGRHAHHVAPTLIAGAVAAGLIVPDSQALPGRSERDHLPVIE